MPVLGVIAVHECDGRFAGGMPRATAETATPRTNGMASRGDPGVPMTTRQERDDQSDKRSSQTEDLMKEASPPSVLGDAEDVVTPESDGELTPWSSPRRDEEEGEA